jgi:hypothetical protein
MRNHLDYILSLGELNVKREQEKGRLKRTKYSLISCPIKGCFYAIGSGIDAQGVGQVTVKKTFSSGAPTRGVN